MKYGWAGLVGLTALLGLAGAGRAGAADLTSRPAVKAPPVVSTIHDWGGFYIGGNGGWGSSRTCWDVNPGTAAAAAEGCHDATGGVAGGQIGYRWQGGPWVLGVEAQGDWADLRGANPSTLAPALTNRSKVDAFGLFTGQVGYAWSNLLLYFRGGAAVTSDKYQGVTTAAGIPFDAASQTRWGGAVGIGGEYGFARNWSVAVQYDHLFMDRNSVGFTTIVPPVGPSRTDAIRQDVDLATLRVNYRWGGPVIAKY